MRPSLLTACRAVFLLACVSAIGEDVSMLAAVAPRHMPSHSSAGLMLRAAFLLQAPLQPKRCSPCLPTPKQCALLPGLHQPCWSASLRHLPHSAAKGLMQCLAGTAQAQGECRVEAARRAGIASCCVCRLCYTAAHGQLHGDTPCDQAAQAMLMTHRLRMLPISRLPASSSAGPVGLLPTAHN